MAIECVTKHTAYIYDRGGQKRLFQLYNMAEVVWGRVRDDISEANIKIAAGYCYDQAAQLDQIEPIRHELVIYRGDMNAFGIGPKRVWEGPVTRIGLTTRQMEIHARDVIHHLSRTNMHVAYNNNYPNVAFAIDRVKKIINDELTYKEAREQAAFPDLPSYGILPYVQYHQRPTDAKTSRATKAMQKTVWEEVDDMAAKGGIDYCAVGRAIHVWDTSADEMGVTQTVTEADFLGELTVTIYGMELKTEAVVTDGEGAYGIAGGVDPYYGVVENLETAYDESEGADPPTSAEMASQASRNLSGSNPVPIVLRVPDNSTLNPKGVLSLDDLVPGVHIPLRAKILVKTITQMQKLDRMTVTETAETETITVTMFPAAQPDEPVEP